jgi:hypothetical protein
MGQDSAPSEFCSTLKFDGTVLMILGHVTRLGGKTSVITFQNKVELIILIKRF